MSSSEVNVAEEPMVVREEADVPQVIPETLEEAVAIGPSALRAAVRVFWRDSLSQKARENPWKYPSKLRFLTEIVAQAYVEFAERDGDGEDTQLLAAELFLLITSISTLGKSGNVRVNWGGPERESYITAQREADNGDVSCFSLSETIANYEKMFVPAGENSLVVLEGGAPTSQRRIYFDAEWIERVSFLAASRGKCWLLLAPEEVIKTMAEDEPVQLMDGLHAAGEIASGLNMLSAGKMTTQAKRMLKAFFFVD